MIKSKDYQIDNQNVEYLISRCDGDLSFIMNELPNSYYIVMNQKLLNLMI